MQTSNNHLLAKATSDSSTISRLEDYIRTLESQNQILEQENAKLSSQNRNLKQRERNTAKLEQAIERLSKDKAKLLSLMRQSQEFKLLGNMGKAPNQITYLHSLGFFSDYEVDKIQLTQKRFPSKAAIAGTFDAGLRKKYSSAKKGKSGQFDPARVTRDSGKGPSGKNLKLRPCQAQNLFWEEQMWVDEDLREFTMKMRGKLNQRFSEELMEHLLFRINSHFLAKVDVFRRSGHLFCKYCRGVPPQKSAQNKNERNLDFLKTLKEYGKLGFSGKGFSRVFSSVLVWGQF